MAVVEPTGPDFLDLEKEQVRIPESWWERIDAAAAYKRKDRFSAMVYMVCWSLDKGDRVPLAEGAELRDWKASSAKLTRQRWKQIDAEADSRGERRNRIFQSHLLRGLAAEEADIAALKTAEKKPPKR